MTNQLLERPDQKLLPPPAQGIEAQLDEAVEHEVLYPAVVSLMKRDIEASAPDRRADLEKMALEAIKRAERLGPPSKFH